MNNLQNGSVEHQIKQWLMQGAGRAIENCAQEGDAATQLAVSMLVTCGLELSEEEGGGYDIYIAKPILRATVIVLKKHISAATNALSSVTDEVIKQKLTYKIKDYEKTVITLEELINHYSEPKDSRLTKES